MSAHEEPRETSTSILVPPDLNALNALIKKCLLMISTGITRIN